MPVNLNLEKTYPERFLECNQKESGVASSGAWRDGEKGGVLGSDQCRLHPLIHTLPDFTLAQDIEKKKSGASETPLFLG